MERKRLNSGKWVFGMLLTLFAVAGISSKAHGQEYRCPSAQGKSPLVDADVFDGPPSGKVELAPDVSQGKMGNPYAWWNVGFLSGSSHRVYLVRRYEGLGPERAVTAKSGRETQRGVSARKLRYRKLSRASVRASGNGARPESAAPHARGLVR